jgi:transposase
MGAAIPAPSRHRIAVWPTMCFGSGTLSLFTFLRCPGLVATNWRADQAIRPMVVTRKVWGGNRTSRGAHAQNILVSILQTCRQQLPSASSILQKMVCASQPKPLDLTGT